ncbi:MAG: sulfatase [Bryobacterales bacterium]|nr:sulfatase [Bryobacterales bacterium]
MQWNRREFLLSAAPALLAAPSAPKTNVIVILADDLGASDLGCYGSNYYETPNLDAFAESGIRFTQAYASCPVCSPSRAGIMTGKYPARLHLTDWIPGRRQHPSAKLLTPAFEQQLPLAETTIAEVLKGAGYVTASIGKWHLGGDGFLPTNQGFDLNIGGSAKGSPPSYFPPYHIPGLEERFANDYLTDNLTSRAEQFIESNRERPFFLYLPHFAVHLPMMAKQQMTEKYQRKAGSMRAQGEPVYAAMLESLDEGVGRILRKLDDLDIAGRTAVFFLSDNGGLRFEGKSKTPVTDNSPFRAGKGHLYEGGIRIPWMARWPGITKKGTACETPVTSIDILPTVAGLLGLRTPEVDGVNIAPLLKGGHKLSREALYWHYPHYSNQGGVPGGAVRHGDYKLIQFYEDMRVELFHLRQDPSERRNLVNKEPKIAARLQRMLEEWRKGVDAAMPVVNPAYDAATADQGLTGEEKPTPPV